MDQAGMSDRRQSATGLGAWLTRLAHDKRANTMAIVAMSLIPLAGMVGGGVDISRMYIVKTRLQHACDAGALAGRKQMGGGTWGFNNFAARAQAERFFDANIQSNPYGASGVSKSFTENAGRVSGTASATLPMTLMRIFGRTTETVTVTCDAEMRLPNTDVMFVLDVTGSMNSKAVSTDTQTKIQALRSSVKCFYEIVARLDTDEVCATGTPSGGTGGTTQVRFGFVPYDANVNVGRLLPSDWFANSWPYQSRERAFVNGRWSSFESTTQNAGTYSGWITDQFQTAANSTQCNGLYPTIPADEWTPNGTPLWPDSGTESDTGWRAFAPYTQKNWQRSYNSSTKVCALQYRTRSIQRRTWYTRTAAAADNVEVFTFPAWTYKQVTLDISGLKNGTGWNSSVTLPIGNNHGNAAIGWAGCIEERATVRQASYSPIPAAARDLDIDGTPNSGDPDSLWAPALRDAIYPRKASYTNSGSYTMDPVTTFNQSYTGLSWTCPTEGKLLQQWPEASSFSSYVDTMWGGGNTYHDIGLLWGARLMSPTGIFRAQNEFTPQGGEIERHMIFMTDGDACTSEMNYQTYGVAWYDRRQTDPAVAPTSGCTTTGTLTQQVNARTQALCTAIKNKNITLWVIWFGASNATIEGMMSNCASSGRYFAARNAADLQNTFKQIADQISALRLTR
jgi:Flp pilus assembly protein TadG